MVAAVTITENRGHTASLLIPLLCLYSQPKVSLHFGSWASSNSWQIITAFTTIPYTMKLFKPKSFWSLFHLKLLSLSSEMARQKARLLKVTFGWSNKTWSVQSSPFRLSANYVFNNVLKPLRVKLPFENSLCHSTTWLFKSWKWVIFLLNWK